MVLTVHDGTTTRLPTCSGTRCPAACRIGCRGLPKPFRVETVPAFAQYIGIDYSGAQTPTASLKGLRVYLAEGDAAPVEVPPLPSPRKYWTRRGIAEWLVERLAEAITPLPARAPISPVEACSRSGRWRGRPTGELRTQHPINRLLGVSHQDRRS